MADFNTTVNNRLASLIVDLSSAEGPINLSNSTVAFSMGKNGIRKINAAACTILSASNGTVRYDWSSSDVDTAGLFQGQFIVTTAGKTQAIPDEGYLYVNIQPGTGSASSTPAGDTITWTQVVDEDGSDFSNWTNVVGAGIGTISSDGTTFKANTFTPDGGGDPTLAIATLNDTLLSPLCMFEGEVQINNVRNSFDTHDVGIGLTGVGSSDQAVVKISSLFANGTGASLSGGWYQTFASGGIVPDSPTSVTFDQWYKIRVVVLGDRWNVYLDDVDLGVIVMAPGTAGGIGGSTLCLVSQQSECEWQHVKAWNADLSLPS